jgi:UDP-N-acetyl-2-amino-2-deoxyglucuronate dehydrogenase
MKNFSIIGSEGYIARRHFDAIQRTKNNLVFTYDKIKNNGQKNINPANHFTSFNKFKNAIVKFQKTKKMDYLVVCSPNYLHFFHIKLGLKLGCNVICEKPLVESEKKINILRQLEKKYKKKVFCILQLRLHEVLSILRKRIKKKNNYIKLFYITPRDQNYLKSWKGEDTKSFGLLFNIGIHFIDLLIYLFGDVIKKNILINTPSKIKGIFFFKNCIVNWLFSINRNDLPKKLLKNNNLSFRSIVCNSKKIDFSSGFENLHILSYKKILANKGFVLDDCVKSINLINNINNN